MIKKIIKNKYPYLHKIYYIIKTDIEYKYYTSVSESKYPDLLAKIYRKTTGLELNWNNLVTYNEKMQWAKLYDKNPLKTKLSDKLLVRDWIKEKIGEEYLIPLLGVWDKFDEIDFTKLPDKFVLKTNHGVNTNIIVNDKYKFDVKSARRKFNKWIKLNFAFINGFELHYKDIKPKIFAEQYLECSNGDLRDYKFLCFNGEIHFCWVDSGRYTDHRRNIYDLNWNLQEWQLNYKNADYPIDKPENFEKMVELVRKLCKDFSHVRVDLYNLDGKIYFSEMTFTTASGFSLIQPYSYNIMLGNMWTLPIKTINK